jgi:hypothetical protein
VSRVSIVPSPVINVFYAHHPLKVVCDSGATSSLIHYSVVVRCNIPMRPTNHTASQADGISKMKPKGEITTTLTRGCLHFKLEAVVVEELDCDILGGMPFLKVNEIVLDAPRDKIIVQGKHGISYTGNRVPKKPPGVGHSQTFLLRANERAVIWPGDYVQLEVPDNLHDGEVVAVEPRLDSSNEWVTPIVTTSVCGRVRIPNLTSTSGGKETSTPRPSIPHIFIKSQC